MLILYHVENICSKIWWWSNLIIRKFKRNLFKKPCEKTSFEHAKGQSFLRVKMKRKPISLQKIMKTLKILFHNKMKSFFSVLAFFWGVVYYNILPKNLHLQGINDFKVLKRYVLVHFLRGRVCG